MHLSATRRRLKVMQGADISTHRSIVHEVIQDALRQASQPRVTRVGGPSARHSVGLTGPMPEAKTLESVPPANRRSTQTESTPSGIGPVSPTEKPSGKRAAASMRVVSAVELIKQPGQGDEAETEANKHEPPSEDGS
jgi:hypothetical protein